MKQTFEITYADFNKQHLRQALRTLGSARTEAKLAYRLMKLLADVDMALKTAANGIAEILKKHGGKMNEKTGQPEINSNGEYEMPEENREAYAEDFQALLQTKFETKWAPLPANLLHAYQFSPGEIEALLPLLTNVDEYFDQATN